MHRLCRRAAVVTSSLASLTLTIALSAHVARAQVVMSGQWRSGATAIDVQVESWGTDCGPPPASSQSSGGGIVRIVQAGERLSLHSGGRVIHSDVCFGQNPGLKRSSKVVKDNTWITRCETPMTDPRAETGVYTLKLLAPNRLLYQDVSRFRWQLKESLCVATITTIQTLTRLTDAEAAQAAKAPTTTNAPAKPAVTATPAPTTKAGAKAPTPPKLPDLPTAISPTQAIAATPKPARPAAAPTKPTAAPCVPGEAARLALAPRRRRIELGSRLCFKTRVVDKAGCALPPIAPTWSLDHGAALRAKLDSRGCFEASAQAADGEGTFRVTAKAETAQGRSLRAEAVIEVVAADLSALVAKRLFDDPDAGDLEAELAADATNGEHDQADAPAATSRTATRAVGAAEAPVERPPWIWPAIGAVLAILGGAIALVARRRTRVSVVPVATAMPEPSLPTRDASAPKAPVPTQLRCPKCGAIYPPGSAFCGTDGSPLKP